MKPKSQPISSVQQPPTRREEYALCYLCTSAVHGQQRTMMSIIRNITRNIKTRGSYACDSCRTDGRDCDECKPECKRCEKKGISVQILSGVSLCANYFCIHTLPASAYLLAPISGPLPKGQAKGHQLIEDEDDNSATSVTDWEDDEADGVDGLLVYDDDDSNGPPESLGDLDTDMTPAPSESTPTATVATTPSYPSTSTGPECADTFTPPDINTSLPKTIATERSPTTPSPAFDLLITQPTIEIPIDIDAWLNSVKSQAVDEYVDTLGIFDDNTFSNIFGDVQVQQNAPYTESTIDPALLYLPPQPGFGDTWAGSLTDCQISPYPTGLLQSNTFPSSEHLYDNAAHIDPRFAYVPSQWSTSSSLPATCSSTTLFESNPNNYQSINADGFHGYHEVAVFGAPYDNNEYQYNQ
ncbi:hypothetical protein B0H11DRAFT_1910214 [Mycena galericulata]|nr:hypothetical protein B0H11DRAFT_1910214 [Mycena galericulata]